MTCESQISDDVIRVSPMEPTLMTDVRFDHPTSIPVAGVADSRKTQCAEEVLPIRFSRNTQEVPGCVAEPEPEELEVDYGMSSSNDANREKPSTSEEAEAELGNGNEWAADCLTREADSSEPNMDFRKSDTHVQHTAGPGSAEPDEDCGASDVDTTGSRRSMGLGKSKEEKVQHGRTQTASAESEFRHVSNRILDTSQWSSERQRPTRATRRLTRLRYREFETQFRAESRRRCNKLGRRDQAGSDINRVGSFNKQVKKANVRFRSGRGVKQKLIQEINLPTGSQPTSPNQRGYTTRKLSSRADRRIANRPSKEGRKPLLDVQLAGAQDSCRSLLKQTCKQD